jgi:hypothetical protein
MGTLRIREEVRGELVTLFKTGALNHSATLPNYCNH